MTAPLPTSLITARFGGVESVFARCGRFARDAQRFRLSKQLLRDGGGLFASMLLPVYEPRLSDLEIVVKEIRARVRARPLGQAFALSQKRECLAFGIEPVGETRRSGVVRKSTDPKCRRQIGRQQFGERFEDRSHEVRTLCRLACCEKSRQRLVLRAAEAAKSSPI